MPVHIRPATTTTGGGGGPAFDLSLVAYRHVQSAPSAEWFVNHQLGFKPGGIVVVDSAGEIVEGRIEYLDNNTLNLYFYVNGTPSPFSGEAYIS